MCLIYLYVLSIPVQPHGMRILMTYKFGSARMGTESHAYGIGTCVMLLRCVDESPWHRADGILLEKCDTAHVSAQASLSV